MPYRRKTDRGQVAAYLAMLEYAATNDKDSIKVINALNTEKMSEKATNSAATVNTTTATENTAKTAANTASNGFSFANQFNKVSFAIDVTDFEYAKLATLYNAERPNTVYKLDGVWVNKSPLGEAPVFIVAELGKLVNMPSHLTATARDILNNAAAVDAIKNGKVGFTVYEYESHARKCYNVRFVDL